jgi:penicillin-binding protein 1A
MVSAYSTFPNKGVRVQPHFIRKVLDRDGKVLEEWDKTTYKVTSEYVALSMVEMMQGVTKPGGTAPGANAAGQPLAGKTGTVNDHTDVWFIGYTPTYVTGVWMGNPKRKTNLGSGMTGGGGALPYFNDFMSEFMKGKEKEAFPDAPDIPPEITALVEQRKREELEKLEKADAEGRKLGIKFETGTKSSGIVKKQGESKTITLEELQNGETDGTLKPPPPLPPANNDGEKTNPKPPAPKPETDPPPAKTPVPKPPQQEGTKRKGKKGDN